MTDLPTPAGPECALETEQRAEALSEIVTAQLAAAVEFRCGGRASLSHASRVRVERPAGGVLEAHVHVFDLDQNNRIRRAYAWPASVDQGKANGIRVVLHLPSILSPRDAVLRAIGARKD